jgi:type II secretory pathway pseudopilin PulG
MKKSFTLLEVIFVIVVIGILSSMIIPRVGSDKLNEAASQLVSHIRYTQHLAMINDKYDVNQLNGSKVIWFEKRWRLKFSKSQDTEEKYSYTIFDDRLQTATGNPDAAEVAVNPLNRSKKLTGGAASATMIHTGDPQATNEMNIGKEYGILDVDFASECRTANVNKVITFDHLGRPIRGATSDMSSPYSSSTNSNNILISQRCIIDLCTVSDCNSANSAQKITIAIEPETGYSCVLNTAGNCTAI